LLSYITKLLSKRMDTSSFPFIKINSFLNLYLGGRVSSSVDINTILLSSSSDRITMFSRLVMEHTKNPKLYCIVGNIGVGKSEFVKRFRLLANSKNNENTAPVTCVDEPVPLWQKIGLLQALYRDLSSGDAKVKGTPYKFQQMAFSSRLRDFVKIDFDKNRIVLVDGHVFIDRHVFAEQLHSDEMISDEDMGWYIESFNHWQELVPVAMPTCFIYLKASPQICHDRLKARGREEEKNVSVEYLTALHNRFESLKFPSEVRIVDASQPPDVVVDEIISIIGKCKALGEHDFCGGDDNCKYCQSLAVPLPSYKHCCTCTEIYQLVSEPPPSTT
jgi:deoxyadenosine/deoxycytidine kinase